MCGWCAFDGVGVHSVSQCREEVRSSWIQLSQHLQPQYVDCNLPYNCMCPFRFGWWCINEEVCISWAKCWTETAPALASFPDARPVDSGLLLLLLLLFWYSFQDVKSSLNDCTFSLSLKYALTMCRSPIMGNLLACWGSLKNSIANFRVRKQLGYSDWYFTAQLFSETSPLERCFDWTGKDFWVENQNVKFTATRK